MIDVVLNSLEPGTLICGGLRAQRDHLIGDDLEFIREGGGMCVQEPSSAQIHRSDEPESGSRPRPRSRSRERQRPSLGSLGCDGGNDEEDSGEQEEGDVLGEGLTTHPFQKEGS